ncbi:Uma2 family endonuclease [Actinomadura adrarensis]|uniref:Uma2 family endonuclease n=1 Tax=Actinomadura adrarensis TaxID=1819600 RepID=A0ABW3CQ20_9ACTN
MTAEPMPEYTPEPAQNPDALPDWLIPPPDGWRAEDLDRIPQLPAHTELIDGDLVFVIPQRDFHTVTMDMLVNGLRRTAPDHLRVRREMSVTLDERQRPEPDIVVLHAEAIKGPAVTSYAGAYVVLAVEVVSPSSELLDRKRKPQLYAEAGVPHYWLVDMLDNDPRVSVFELDPASDQYVQTGVHHNRLKVSVPYDIDIDLTEGNRL